jgi:hypothetical protein
MGYERYITLRTGEWKLILASGFRPFMKTALE